MCAHVLVFLCATSGCVTVNEWMLCVFVCAWLVIGLRLAGPWPRWDMVTAWRWMLLPLPGMQMRVGGVHGCWYASLVAWVGLDFALVGGRFVLGGPRTPLLTHIWGLHSSPAGMGSWMSLGCVASDLCYSWGLWMACLSWFHLFLLPGFWGASPQLPVLIIMYICDKEAGILSLSHSHSTGRILINVFVYFLIFCVPVAVCVDFFCLWQIQQLYMLCISICFYST